MQTRAVQTALGGGVIEVSVFGGGRYMLWRSHRSKAAIRPAAMQDVAGIAEIWAHLVRDTSIVMDLAPKSQAQIAQILQDDPPLVVDEGGRVAGFAMIAPFHAGFWPMDRICCHMIAMAPFARARGLGRDLLSALEDRARGAGYAHQIAMINAESRPALAFHRAMGYGQVGHLRQVAEKFGRAHDAIVMQKKL